MDANEPIDVILGCAAVCKVPVKLVDVKEVIPLIDPVLLNTTALELVAAPATTPDKYDASDPITEPAIEIDVKDPTDVILGCAPVCRVPVNVEADTPLVTVKELNVPTDVIFG